MTTRVGFPFPRRASHRNDDSNHQWMEARDSASALLLEAEPECAGNGGARQPGPFPRARFPGESIQSFNDIRNACAMNR